MYLCIVLTYTFDTDIAYAASDPSQSICYELKYHVQTFATICIASQLA